MNETLFQQQEQKNRLNVYVITYNMYIRLDSFVIQNKNNCHRANIEIPLHLKLFHNFIYHNSICISNMSTKMVPPDTQMYH